MKKIVTIIGARPQIIKASAISRAIKHTFKDFLTEIIVHTGQHYNQNMSEVFFEELSIPKPNYNLNVGSGFHGQQTAKMIHGIEEILLKENPNAIVLYGDTNSTLAGAIAASKLSIPIVHVEAGLRSFNKSMPEEVNRIVCDQVSTLLFSPTKAGYYNLTKEGFKENTTKPYSADNPKIYHSGDVMYDNSLFFLALSDNKSTILKSLELRQEKYILCTIHRNNNTDDENRLISIFEALNELTSITDCSVVLPLHPRTKKCMEDTLPAALYQSVKNNPLLLLIEPVSFLDMIALEKNAKLVITDSGGVQKEAYFFKKPCIILRPETEWVELVEVGSAAIADADKELIIAHSLKLIKNSANLKYPSLFGDGKTAEFICEEILSL